MTRGRIHVRFIDGRFNSTNITDAIDIVSAHRLADQRRRVNSRRCLRTVRQAWLSAVRSSANREPSASSAYSGNSNSRRLGRGVDWTFVGDGWLTVRSAMPRRSAPSRPDERNTGPTAQPPAPASPRGQLRSKRAHHQLDALFDFVTHL
jgi:hypothetical protein